MGWVRIFSGPLPESRAERTLLKICSGRLSVIFITNGSYLYKNLLSISLLGKNVENRKFGVQGFKKKCKN